MSFPPIDNNPVPPLSVIEDIAHLTYMVVILRDDQLERIADAVIARLDERRYVKDRLAPGECDCPYLHPRHETPA